MGSPSRLDQLLTTLKAFYGPLPWPPHDPFTLFVWEVLSYHAAPRKRDAALEALRRSRALTPDAMWRAPRKKLQEAIVLAGPYAVAKAHSTASRPCAIFIRPILGSL